MATQFDNIKTVKQINDEHRLRILERLVALGLAVVIVGTVIYLILRGKPFEDAGLLGLLRIILSVALGIFASSMAGFLNIDYKVRGLRIRAAAGFAVFLVTYFGSPSVPSLNLRIPEAKISAANPSRFEIRPDIFPELTATNWLRSPAKFTHDIVYKNTVQPARTGDVRDVKGNMKVGLTTIDFFWEFFVNQHSENNSGWNGKERSATSFSVAAGATEAKEILHKSQTNISYEDVINLISKSTEKESKIEIISTHESSETKVICTVNTEHWRNVINEYKVQEMRLPRRLTMCCLEHPNTQRDKDCGELTKGTA